MEKTSQLMGIKELFNASWNHFQKHKQNLIYLMLIIISPSIIQSILSSFFYGKPEASLGFVESNVHVGLGIGAVAFLTLASIILSIIGYVAMIRMIKTPSLSVGDAFKQGTQLFWSSLLVHIILLIILLGGFLLFIIPGIILSVYFGFALYTLALDGEKGWNALQKSKDLVHGYWWPLVGRYLAFLIPFLIPMFILQGALAYLTVMQSLVPIIIMQLIVLAYGIFMQIFGYIYSFNIYENLKKLPRQTNTVKNEQ